MGQAGGARVMDDNARRFSKRRASSGLLGRHRRPVIGSAELAFIVSLSAEYHHLRGRDYR